MHRESLNHRDSNAEAAVISPDHESVAVFLLVPMSDLEVHVVDDVVVEKICEWGRSNHGLWFCCRDDI